MAQIVETLIDLECAVFCDTDDLRGLAGRTGAALVDPAKADHLFLSAAPSPDMLRTLRMGSDLHPEDGASVIFPATVGAGRSLRLTGPGCDGAVDIALDVDPAIWTERARMMRYPMGVEMLLIDGDRVLGLPRSTQIEVL